MTEINNAVTFDADAFRAWLGYSSEPTVAGSATNQQVSPLLSSAYQRLDGEAGWLVESTLDMLRGSETYPAGLRPWVYGEGVADLRVWATAAPEGGADGGLAGEVMVDGVLLSIGRLLEEDMVPGIYDILPGYEATEHALTAVAEQINAAAEQFRTAKQVGAPADWMFAGLSRLDIECALKTLADFYDKGGVPEELSEPQINIADVVSRMVRAVDEDDDEDEDDVVDAEIIEDDGAYARAAAAVDNDVNHPAHPTHW